MVAVHGWSGILLGLLLYAVVLTGTAAVFAHEIGAWSAGHVAARSSFAQPLDAVVRDLAARTPKQYREAVNLFEVGDGGLGVFFHRHETDANGVPTESGIYYRLDNAGRMTGTARGNVEDVFGPANDDALSHFLVDTHVRLHVPNPWGLLLTGVVGLAMLVAAISGLLIHRHLFTDIFTLRRRGNPVLVQRDAHSVAGTWSLPFAFVLAFTGSFFSFYGTIGVPVVAMAAFGGDVAALTQAVYGNPGKPDARPAAISNLDRIVADATRRGGSAPTFVAIENFGRADAGVTTYHDPRASDVEPVTLLYEGASARFLRAKATIGTRPSAGGTLVGIMGPLHFGSFAGLLSKAVWFGLGFAMCYVTYTGMRLWVIRRRTEAGGLRSLERAITVVGIGLPFALVAAAAAFLIALPLGVAIYWTTAGFLIASAVAIVASIIVPTNDVLANVLTAATGATMIALPPLRLVAAGGPHWGEAWVAHQPMIVAIDVGLFVAGAWLIIRCASRSMPSSRHPAAIRTARA
ncbi:PepSY-associated TM helix domain-containing protein [Sphingomonas sp. 1P08PE]|uniref:PepSY-associated TM helix domain-containing protein n=1 Tax=Sphingomonas sp. 1P08PE TaxID=554122 RepID=UPI00399FA3EB